MREDHHPGAAGLGLVGREEASQRRRHAEGGEERGGDRGSGQPLRAVAPVGQDGPLVVGRHGDEGLDPAPDVDEVGVRDRPPLQPVAAIEAEHLDQRLGLVEGQGTEQHAADDREERRGGAHAERQSEDGGDGESGLTAQTAEGEPEVAPQGLDPGKAVLAAALSFIRSGMPRCIAPRRRAASGVAPGGGSRRSPSPGGRRARRPSRLEPLARQEVASSSRQRFRALTATSSRRPQDSGRPPSPGSATGRSPARAAARPSAVKR